MDKSERCSERVHDGYNYGGHQCLRAGVVVENGQKWCKQHAPSAVQRRQEEWRAKFEEDSKRRNEMWDFEAKRNALFREAGVTLEDLRAGRVRVVVDRPTEEK